MGLEGGGERPGGVHQRPRGARAVGAPGHGRPPVDPGVADVDQRASVGGPGRAHVRSVAEGKAGERSSRQLLDPDGVVAVLEHFDGERAGIGRECEGRDTALRLPGGIHGALHPFAGDPHRLPGA